MNKRKEGSIWENLAAAYLAEQGLLILEKNYRTRLGEIDLIAKEKDTLVFVEVKYRKTDRMGLPEEAVTRKKQGTIRKVAESYRSFHWKGTETPCRFDVIAVLGEEITWIKNAF